MENRNPIPRIEEQLADDIINFVRSEEEGQKTAPSSAYNIPAEFDPRKKADFLRAVYRGDARYMNEMSYYDRVQDRRSPVMSSHFPNNRTPIDSTKTR